MKFRHGIIVILILFTACREKQANSENWTEYQLERPKITIQLPDSFRQVTNYPDDRIFTDTTTVFLWPNEPYVAVGIHSQYKSFDDWYRREHETVRKQKRKLYRETKQFGDFTYDLMRYSKMNSSDTLKTEIQYAFVRIDSALYDIHNQLEDDQMFLEFLKRIKKTSANKTFKQ